jgi:hypothetical protein
VIGCIAAFIAACGTAVNTLVPVENDLSKLKKDYPDATVADLQQGFALFKMNCGGCHTLHLPNEKTREQWAKILPEMFQKTALNDQEKLRITEYLFSKVN